ncbi:MAG TPA: Crp/Fnr family transcriptional regulator [Candidatus Limnocylindrales bacterium]|nr:Crp/Fnr family transcriptional regulator [Candidatus Limnocylindrales bacterium]
MKPRSNDPTSLASTSAGHGVAVANRLKALASMQVFEGLSEDTLAHLATRARCRRFTRGQFLTDDGNEPAAVHALVAGTAKWTMTCPSGRADLLLEILHPGELFGEAEIFGGASGSCQAVALTDGEMLVLPAGDLPELLARNPEVAVRWLELVCRRLQRMRQLAADAVFLDIGGRLYRRLLDICRLEPASITPGERLHHGLSQRELASSIGASRESLNKILATWQRQGIVTVGRGVLVIRKPSALARAAASIQAHPSMTGPGDDDRESL